MNEELKRLKGAAADAQIALDRLARIELEYDSADVAAAIGAVVKLRDKYRRQYQDLRGFVA